MHKASEDVGSSLVEGIERVFSRYPVMSCHFPEPSRFLCVIKSKQCVDSIAVVMDLFCGR